MNRFAECLFARPSFLEGAARIMDFRDSMTRFNTSPTPEEADRIGLASDWAAVAHYIRYAKEAERKEANRHGCTA